MINKKVMICLNGFMAQVKKIMYFSARVIALQLRWKTNQNHVIARRYDVAIS